MTVRDLLDKKDYAYVEWRVTAPENIVDEEDILFGYCEVVNGNLISGDGDSYDEDTEVLRYEEWLTQDKELCLTIVEEVEWC